MHYQACYTYLRAVLGARAARLRTALADGERGASAVELAVITAVILVIAVALLGIIRTFVTTQSNQIQNTNP
jgi:Flp pilus assembly pilin Flp